MEDLLKRISAVELEVGSICDEINKTDSDDLCLFLFKLNVKKETASLVMSLSKRGFAHMLDEAIAAQPSFIPVIKYFADKFDSDIKTKSESIEII